MFSVIFDFVVKGWFIQRDCDSVVQDRLEEVGLLEAGGGVLLLKCVEEPAEIGGGVSVGDDVVHLFEYLVVVGVFLKCDVCCGMNPDWFRCGNWIW